jgi:FMN phosphatase YigB (HAD superfamily)
MGFNIKNNYGPNIEVNAGGKVTLVQDKDGLWHTVDAEEAEYEELVEGEPLQPAPTDAEELPAVCNQEKDEERFHFVHPEIDDDEAWRIHNAVKRLVAHQRVPEICAYLKELKQRGKVMLPSVSAVMYKELVRLGMPTGDGYSEKHFSNSYTK